MPKKTNGYSHYKADQRRKQRQHAADDRQQDYDSLSVPAKIELAKSRGGSVRELAKLTGNPVPKRVKKKF